MPLTHADRLHAAGAVRDQLRARRRGDRRRSAATVGQAVHRLERLRRVEALMHHAAAYRWEAAFRRLRAEAARLLDALADTGRAFGRIAAPPAPVPSLHDVYRDLAQAEEEFADVRYRTIDLALTAVTAPVVLEGVYLGPFAVTLRLRHLHDPASSVLYELKALDPQPARSDEAVTHPHVRDGGLCAGDAGAAIGAALGAGRLCDFFLVVRSVLETYNPSSPYVALCDWGGVPCADCDATVQNDETFTCVACEAALCEYCASSCFSCEETLCRSCLSPCPACGKLTCRDCLTTCPDCEGARCAACLESGCPCTEETDHDDRNRHATDTETPTAVQAVFP